MSARFEDRLERELLAAARRRSERRAASRLPRLRLIAAPHRSGRPLLATAGALAALLLVAAFVFALPLRGGSDTTPSPAAPAPPSACDRLDPETDVRWTAAPVDRRLLDAYAVLRRPQTARDRAHCPFLPVDEVNPDALRFARRDPLGRPIYFVPGVRRAGPGAPPAMMGPHLCVVIGTGRGAGGICGPAKQYARGAAGSGSLGRVAVGVERDGAATLELRRRDGSRQRVPIVANVWAYRQERGAPARTNPVVGIALLDADGRVVRRIRGGPIRGFRPVDG